MPNKEQRFVGPVEPAQPPKNKLKKMLEKLTGNRANRPPKNLKEMPNLLDVFGTHDDKQGELDEKSLKEALHRRKLAEKPDTPLFKLDKNGEHVLDEMGDPIFNRWPTKEELENINIDDTEPKPDQK
ncbi:MAG: hypothetical protein COU31_03500 [Candidatus Magasanikbacteria bacterium CG10_big_fil_rev_8_21_14_0_10_40_10]|uniref:Uncharacterized protein n=1 Tax=Candidatus Magasanikbacteria bacterium CG10_big_fil_rev_8_21_14_0_10_40_10 TaxID=1974648 RepID=A0A2M6W3E3_9BACT|nr:MAG: hypothetical protein COU31_03500 [Candidatus Magasanikbacteria bacterium CG10_big_fil_rev_8_21_14_0_10_40_10]